MDMKLTQPVTKTSSIQSFRGANCKLLVICLEMVISSLQSSIACYRESQGENVSLHFCLVTENSERLT
jgi:hypothetical protein